MSFRDDARMTVAALQAYSERAASRDGPVLRQPNIDTLADELDLEQLIAEGGLEGRDCADRYLAGRRAYTIPATWRIRSAFRATRALPHSSTASRKSHGHQMGLRLRPSNMPC